MILSIVIPVYNGAEFIEGCVDSLMNQGLKLREFEILIINDGSKDNSKEIIDKISCKYNNINAYHKDNEGLAATRNFGLDRIQGKYLYYLDVDDYIAHNTLKPLLRCLVEEDLDILCFESLKTKSRSLLISSNLPEKKSFKVTDGITYVAQNNIEFEVWRYITKTSFLSKLGIRFDSEKLLEDVMYTMNLFAKAKRMARIKLDVHRYVQEPTSILHKTNTTHELRLIEDLIILAKECHKLAIKYECLDHPEKKGFLNKLHSKKQFLVYYAVVRSYKSQCSFDKVWNILQCMKEIGVYPFSDFSRGEDPTVKKMIFIFNRKTLLHLLFNVIRPLQNFKSQLSS